MSDLLAVVGEEITDEDLLAEISRRRPDRVTVLAGSATIVASRRLSMRSKSALGQMSSGLRGAAASFAAGGLTGWWETVRRSRSSWS